MRIVVADNGYTNFLQGSQEEPKMVIQDVTIQVEAVNDMPYLSWLHLPPKDGMGGGPRNLWDLTCKTLGRGVAPRVTESS